MRLTFGHATLRKRFGKADATRTQSVAIGLSFRAYAIAFPDSRFPIPDSRFPIPYSQFPTPYSLTKKNSRRN
ncbi:MAG: hypothetical protein F6J98_20575, partial [Moorea sp. SIO4G2]|nr:hypothetical protein [Moorena sp. SIO4G2]